MLDLTPRQIEVLGLLADGLTQRQAATRLGLGEATVKTTLGNAYARIGATSAPHAVALALRAGLID